MTAYIATGSVRGDCGHRHRTPGAALACARQDGRNVKRGHGECAYSDRQPAALSGGNLRPLTAGEWDRAYDETDG